MQRWISPRDVLDLWEELERDVERIGTDQIGSSIQACKLKESEVCCEALEASNDSAMLAVPQPGVGESVSCKLALEGTVP